MPAASPSMIPGKCGTVPLPDEPKLVLPGSDLGNARISAMFFTLVFGPDTMQN